ncbi:MAG: P-type conjugative transfer protein TrbL [Halothiobacillus sp.]|nr:P-type conjugative transfer protein TrbL [Halothiobacillus sp.]
MKNKLLLVLLVIGLAATNLVYAATPTNPTDPDVFLDLATQFHDATDNWTVTAQNIGYWIFFTLATLEMTWAAALWAMEKDSASSLIVALVRKMMVLGFFYTFLVFAPTWLPAIINSLLGAGEKIGGHAATPGSLIATGLLVIQKLWAAWGNTPVDGITSFFLSLTAALLLIPVSFIVIFAFVFIAVELIITTIESYIVVGMGLVLMGFSGSQWTRDFSQKYIGYAFSVGVKLMVLTLIVSVIITITNACNYQCLAIYDC